MEVGANITDYNYTKSIMGIKTRVRLLSKEDAVVYEEVNTGLEGKIGVFMEVKSVDDSYNDAQIKELVQSVFAIQPAAANVYVPYPKICNSVSRLPYMCCSKHPAEHHNMSSSLSAVPE